MQALLKQQGLWGPVSAKQKKAMVDEDEWNTLVEKAHSATMLSFSVIIEVSAQKTTVGLWLKLESMYMTNSLTNKLHLKQHLFSLRMQEGTPLRKYWECAKSSTKVLKGVKRGTLYVLQGSMLSGSDAVASSHHSVELETGSYE
ncbi:unnamed protein product [Linum trigynum]|uniref:Uncharacterized protein n=1 Tax=Linum trigynum TaxID=586398 RepID=A0AAV2DAZ1_9ROSI